MKAKIIKTEEIVEVYHEPQHNIYKESVLVNGRMWTEDELDFSINSEEKEVDLEKEYKDFVEEDPVYNKLVNGIVGKAIAKHFFELGLKAVQKSRIYMNYKVEGNIIFPDREMLTWGPFYYHSKEKAIEKSEEILKNITEWCNMQDPSLNIEPKNVIRLDQGTQIIFHIQAWRDENNLENCNGIITIEDIFFQD